MDPGVTDPQFQQLFVAITSLTAKVDVLTDRQKDTQGAVQRLTDKVDAQESALRKTRETDFVQDQAIQILRKKTASDPPGSWTRRKRIKWGGLATAIVSAAAAVALKLLQ